MKYHHGNLKLALLQRAEEVIAKGGIEAVKLSRLAKDIGVSHSAPARHFKNRNALLAVLAIRAIEELISDIKQAKGYADKCPRVRLNSFLKVQLHNVVKRPAHFSIMGNPDTPTITGPTYNKLFDVYSDMLSKAIRDAQNDGWNSEQEESLLLIYALSLAVGLETNVRYAITAKGSITSNNIIKTAKKISNAEHAIDFFISCER